MKIQREFAPYVIKIETYEDHDKLIQMLLRSKIFSECEFRKYSAPGDLVHAEAVANFIKQLQG